jgi:SAM-dependent methyltransferase
VNGNQPQNRWEQLAREDAEFYIWTDLAAGDEFFRSGERDVARILDFARPPLDARGSALEIGCGVGRLSIPMSRTFGSITAVDIAPTMLEKLGANCRQRGIDNVRGMLGGDSWDATQHDFAYTRIVLQHIDPWAEIVSYLERIARALRPGGLLYAQFDTRAPNLLYGLRNRLPDRLLPRTYRRGVRRIRRHPSQILAAAENAGLALMTERGGGTEDHEFLFRRTPR